MATSRQREGGKWEFKVSRRGVLPRPVYLTFPTQAAGTEYCRRLEALLDRGIVPEELSAKQSLGPALLAHAREYQSTQHISESDRRVLAVVLDELKAVELRAITFAWAGEWVSRMKRVDNLSPRTIRHRVGALARCLDWIARRGDLAANPLRLLPKGFAIYTPDDARIVRAHGGQEKTSAERDRRLEGGEEMEIRRILAGGKPKGRQRPLTLEHGDALAMLFDTIIETGMRLRETYTLEWSQVDTRRKTIFLDKTKNGSRRQVPISSTLLARIRAYRGDFAGRLFPWWNGQHSHAELARATALLSRQFARVFDAAGCGDLHEHDLRHEATCRFYEKTDLSDVEIAKILGWKSLRQAMRYANLRGSTLAARLW